MAEAYGFELIREEEVPEVNGVVRLYRHKRSGAELLTVSNDDENKVFGANFRTPPSDSTGVPHIMEHSVLGGSRKYRAKEPFVELVKGSMNTFLNAMTYPDKTIYPVASQNLQDFYNLVDVYLDAVFHPLLTREHLAQEGWHFELESPDAPLMYRGIVFNEMKGAYSSPDNVLYRYSSQELLPDTPYGVDSGGDPKEIPNLTYEQFKAFHEMFYHPSNARLYFYGDDPEEERLRILDAYLRDFEAKEVASAIPLQRPFPEPRTIIRPYSVDANETDPKNMVMVNWALPEITNPADRLLLSVLDYCLLGTPGSPLRQTLLDSGLGEDTVGGGFSSHTRQVTFDIGLKGVKTENRDKVEPLVMETLSRLAESGFDGELVEAAVNTIEFSLRENNTGSYPRGLLIMLRTLSQWLYDRDPIEPLKYEAPLAEVKKKLAENPELLPELIGTYLLNNSHRLTVILEPDPELNQREEAEERAKLDAIQKSLSDEEIQAIIDYTAELKKRQETPDPPELLAQIPSLTLDDIDKENKTIPIEATTYNGAQLLFHDLFTNGIAYVDVGFNFHTLPEELLPYIKLFGRALLELGTETEDFIKLSQRIGRKTGGISPSAYTSAVEGEDQAAAWFFVRGKGTMSQAQDMLAIIRDILLTVKLDNQERFRQLVLKAKARMESGLVPGGHSIVNTRLRAYYGEAGWLAEQLGGVSYLFFLRQLAEQVENDWPAVLAKLEQLRKLLVNREGMVCNVTLDAANWQKFQPHVQAFIDELPAAPKQIQRWQPQLARVDEGLTIPAQVNYVGKGTKITDLGYEWHGSISVITNYLRTTWLWEKIRAQGGAYGAFVSTDRRLGVLTYLSYRDPNLLNTLKNYDETAVFLRHLDLHEDELVKSIIGVIGDLDSYQLPDAKGFTSMIWHLLGESDARRQQYREQVLNTTADDFKAFADVLDAVAREAQIVVLGSSEAITQANKEGQLGLKVTKVL